MSDIATAARPARPVADAPVGRLSDGDALAKSWLLTLIAGAPLARAGALPAAEMARDAPQLCLAMVAALAGDAELARLEPGGDRYRLAQQAGAITGATEPAGTVAALAALRAALWNAIVGALRGDEGDLVAPLASRLARICDTVAAAVFADVAQADAGTVQGGFGATQGSPGGAAAVTAAPVDAASDVAPKLAVVSPPVVPPAGTPADPAPDPAEPPLPAIPADVFPVVSSPARPATPTESWATTVVGSLSRMLAERTSCAVLAVDIDDAERLLAADVGGEAAALIARAEGAAEQALRPGDASVRERDGRLWIVAGNTSVEAARALAQRVIAAVAGAGDLHGAPLRASVGVATSPPDGDDAASLIAHADEGVYAARAAGVSLA